MKVRLEFQVKILTIEKTKRRTNICPFKIGPIEERANLGLIFLYPKPNLHHNLKISAGCAEIILTCNVIIIDNESYCL